MHQLSDGQKIIIDKTETNAPWTILEILLEWREEMLLQLSKLKNWTCWHTRKQNNFLEESVEEKKDTLLSEYDDKWSLQEFSDSETAVKLQLRFSS